MTQSLMTLGTMKRHFVLLSALRLSVVMPNVVTPNVMAPNWISIPKPDDQSICNKRLVDTIQTSL